MLKMGRKIDEFNQPVCTSFTRKILKDQLCYEVDVNQIKDKSETSENMNLGFGFLYDNNVERSLQVDNNDSSMKKNNLGFLNNFVRLEETQKTLVYISSVGRYYIEDSKQRKSMKFYKNIFVF